jgi:hypothetical protein
MRSKKIKLLKTYKYLFLSFFLVMALARICNAGACNAAYGDGGVTFKLACNGQPLRTGAS